MGPGRVGIVLGQMEDTSTTAKSEATYPSTACLHSKEATLGIHAAENHFPMGLSQPMPIPVESLFLSSKWSLARKIIT